MPIATPVSLGTNSAYAFVTSSIAITTAAAINAGDLVIVAVSIKEGSLYTVSSISDGTNTYAKLNSTNDGSSYDTEVWYKANAAAKATSSSITINLSATGSGAGFVAVAALKIATGTIAPTSVLDTNRTAGNNASAGGAGTNNLTVTSGASNSQADEIIIGVESGYGGGTSWNQSSGFTSVNKATVTDGGGNNLGVGMDYQIVSSTNSVSYGPTWTVNVGNIASMTSGWRGFNLNIPISSDFPVAYNAYGISGY